MALIVEDGTGLANAESFVTIAEIATYATRFGLTWTGTTTVQEVNARKGTAFLEARFGLRMSGAREVLNQALSWPRVGAIDREGSASAYVVSGWYATTAVIASGTVPTPWKDAQCEMSIKAQTEDLYPDLSDSGEVISKDVSVGPIRKAVTYSAGHRLVKLYRKVDAMVARYLLEETLALRA